MLPKLTFGDNSFIKSNYSFKVHYQVHVPILPCYHEFVDLFWNPYEELKGSLCPTTIISQVQTWLHDHDWQTTLLVPQYSLLEEQFIKYQRIHFRGKNSTYSSNYPKIGNLYALNELQALVLLEFSPKRGNTWDRI